MVAFARRTGQSLKEVMEWWHPRDMETWMALDEKQAVDERFAERHQQ